MRLHYNVTGPERKSLVAIISRSLNAPTKYLGAPTFAYEVSDYHIDKVGTLTGPDSLDLEDALHQAGFDADGDTRHYDEPDTYESGLRGLGALPAFEDLRMDELGNTRREDFQGENGIQASDVPDEDKDCLVIEFPLAGFTPDTLKNLYKIVEAKGELIKVALGVDDLSIEVSDEDGGKLLFPWFKIYDYTQADSYTKFVHALCITAKEKKRITAKATGLPYNPKYAMRVFLLSIGFIGDEYKAARKLLLSKLEGSGTHSMKCAPFTACCYTYPNGIEGEAMESESRGFTSLKKAKAYVDTFYADTNSLHFAGAHIEDVMGEWVYEINCE